VIFQFVYQKVGVPDFEIYIIGELLSPCEEKIIDFLQQK